MGNGVLEGQAAIVTGGARGIGRAIAARLARDGADVLIADLDIDTARATASKIMGASSSAARVEAIGADCAEPKAVADVVETALARFARLDIFVANAGITGEAPFLDTTGAQLDRILRTNLRGAFLGIQAAARVMRERGGGRIVATASTNSFWMETNLAVYNASKAGILAVVRTAAMELAPHGITVNAVGPGLIATDLTRSLTEDPDASRSYLRQIPAGRFGTPDDVAGAVAFLVSPDATWITGHLLVVDGGQTLGTPFPTTSS
jgi:NAD(P)-dependent dehydrogenase (short-subunit alcohol dehydrogenase family)